MLKRIPRGWLTAIATLFGALFLVPIFHANVQKWAEAQGYDQFLLRNWEPAVALLASVTQSKWFIFALGFFVGGTIFLWLDYWLRGRANGEGTGDPKGDAKQPQSKKNDEEVLGAIKWRFLAPHYHFIAAKGHERGVDYFGVQASGNNETDELISDFSGTVKSEVTGKEFPITISDGKGNLVDPMGYGIPARHQFHWQVRFTDLGNPLSVTEFLRDYRRLTIRFKYNGQEYKRHFTPEEMEAEVAHAEASLRKLPPRTSAGIIKLKNNDNAGAVHISLGEAARRTYEQTRQTLFASVAESQSKSPDEILQYYAHHFLLKAKIYGCRLPSQMTELLTETEISNMDIRSDNGVVTGRERSGYARYANLKIDASELPRIISNVKAISDWKD